MAALSNFLKLQQQVDGTKLTIKNSVWDIQQFPASNGQRRNLSKKQIGYLFTYLAAEEKFGVSGGKKSYLRIHC